MSFFLTPLSAAAGDSSYRTSYTLQAPSLPPLPALEAHRQEDGTFVLPEATGKRLVEYLYEANAYPAKAQDKINEQRELDVKEFLVTEIELKTQASNGIPMWLFAVGVCGAGAAGVALGVVFGLLANRTIVVEK